ncbi:MAG: hypothetical protein AB2785_01890 [Candidatus Thiodiazotropha endolucinida]
MGWECIIQQLILNAESYRHVVRLPGDVRGNVYIEGATQSAVTRTGFYPIEIVPCHDFMRAKLSGLLSIARPHVTTSISILALLAVTFLANQSALSAFWRFDDGWLLDYASRFSPSDYFLNPAITRGYSLNNLTPFNPFIYDMNLWLFGVSPRGFYIQHLAVMAGCAITTFLLLRIWLAPRFALAGAVLFLVGAPSLIVSQQLMVGHYLAGLMFSILSVHAYVRSIERESWRLSLAALLFYMLATACKEIYVPLPVTLLFIHKGTPGRRIMHAAPMYGWILCYTLWRYLVLGSLIGGYDAMSHGNTWPEKLSQLVGIPHLLFGSAPLNIAVMVVVGVLVSHTLYKRRLNLPLTTVIAAAVLLPMVPLLEFPGITQPNRYLFLPWWLISVICAVAVATLPSSKYPYRMGISLFLIVGVAIHAHQARNSAQPGLHAFDTKYRLFASQAPDTVYFSSNKDAYHQETVLNGIRNALNRVHGAKLQRVGILTKRENLTRLNNRKFSIVQYDQSCNCIREIEDPLTENGKSKHSGQPGMLEVALSPPYPPLFEYATGEIEHISVESNNLNIKGWTELSNEDLEQQFLIITPGRPEQTRLTSIKTDTQNKLMQRYRFDLRLSYRDETTAELYRSGICLLTRSMLTPVRLIHDANHHGCNGFLSSHR